MIRVPVHCEFGISPSCHGAYEVAMRAETKNRARNGGRFICLPCSRRLKHSGRSNPNARHLHLDDRFFEHIDSEGKAYLLGWIASDGHVRKGGIALAIHPKDAPVLEQWKRILGTQLPTQRLRAGALVGLTLNSTGMVEDVCRWLDIAPGKKSHSVGFPALPTEDLKWAFLRGFFDGDGSINRPKAVHSPRCSLTTNSARFRDSVIAFCGIRAYHSPQEGRLEWGGNNALDFLGKLYEGASYRLPRKWDLYLDWCAWVPSLSGSGRHGQDELFRWVKADPQAVPPTKTRPSDSGYDLTLLRPVKQHGLVTFFDTGIKIQPVFGWYFDVVARSSISKTGYMLANAVGVIDRTYTGSILVPLIKVDPGAPDLELPARVVQLIPRPIIHVQWTEVPTLDDTARGAGGFGSTGRH